ncbi:MAG TPA: polyprenol phosphomannose-dependent alpha 1,6 mannosyltransferase MptB [Solirubrobacteraceae bacterium]|nr:polyprenol phosphomannose-dependent alpha 1,6 mannosyltransferase MptB [Solirubrobacteraceae bacterium]
MSVATQGERGVARIRSEWWRPALLSLLALLLVLATGEIVLDGAAGRSPLIPKSPAIAGWLQGIGERLGYRVFLIAILGFAVAYGAMLLLTRGAGARAITKRWAIVLIVALHAIVFAGPILISTDVFSYIAYARMGVEHGINPYLHGPVAISRDPIFQYVGHDWRHVATAYGPLYTLFSYPFAPLGAKGALWAMKIIAQLASAGTLVLIWRCARARDLDPVWAILAVGANPLYVIYGVGGAHNDLLMLLLMMVAVSLTLRGRDAAAGAVVVAGALVKATVAALLPFMILSRRRLAPILGALAAVAAGAVVAYAAFGVHGVDIVAALNRDAAFVSTDSFATEIAHLFGKPGVFPVDHDLLKASLVLIALHLMWRTWRGYDWIAASGWTLLAISVTSTWLLAWYILWPLPLAVLTRDRRLVLATLALQALFLLHQTSPLFAPVQ